MEEEKSKEEIIASLKEDVLNIFTEGGYTESDKLRVAMHEAVDNWASSLSHKEALDFLSQFDTRDFETLDSGLYSGVLEKEGFEKLIVVLAYCLAEQELYNDSLLNDLQNWKNETDKESIALMERAKKEIKKLSEVQ